MKTFNLILIVLSFVCINAQTKNSHANDVAINSIISGTLLLPQNKTSEYLAIIISDYGPTDRNGNQNFQKNNTLKQLAEALSKNGIASFRYDKRSTAQAQKKSKLKNIVFEDFVTDAKAVINYFKIENNYQKIYIIGHGQGSLVGLLASDGVDGFISVAATGENIGDFIVHQINSTARQHVEATKRVVAKLKAGQTTTDFPPELANMFNSKVQPFMISWMKHTPKDILNTINKPVLIINGTKDLEVSVDEAKAFAVVNINAELHIIENMNHVLFTIDGGRLENSKSYNESFRTINTELVTSITDFIKK